MMAEYFIPKCKSSGDASFKVAAAFSTICKVSSIGITLNRKIALATGLLNTALPVKVK